MRCRCICAAHIFFVTFVRIDSPEEFTYVMAQTHRQAIPAGIAAVFLGLAAMRRWPLWVRASLGLVIGFASWYGVDRLIQTSHVSQVHERGMFSEVTR
jgi:hypothetical protein